MEPKRRSMGDILITGTRPWGGEVCDILVRDGRIAARGTGLEVADNAEPVDGTGCMLLPGLVDAHTHLDKTLIGTPWHPHRAGPRLIDKITNERHVLAKLGLDPAVQSARMVRHMLARGTTKIRSHVDIGLDNGLDYFHGVAATREAQADLVQIEIVAFPQTGMMIQPGMTELMEEARQARRPMRSAVSIRSASTATPRDNSMRSSRSPTGWGARSTSTFTTPARSARSPWR